MNAQMIEVVTSRVNEMSKNSEIQKILMGFKNNDEAHNWLIKAAIATLVIPVSER